MRIGVYGAGGVGGLLAGLLSRAGLEVGVVARGATLARLRDRGLRIDSPLGTFDARVDAAESAEKLAPVGAVLLAVKTWQVPAAAAAIAPWLSPDGFVVPLQNGVDAPDECADVVGDARVLGGLCHMLSAVVEPGVVQHVGDAPRVTLGAWRTPLAGRDVELGRALQRAGVRVEVADDFRRALWEKLLFIASFGGVGAVARATAGAIRTTPETRELLAAACREVLAVAGAEGIAMGPDVVARTMAFVDSLPEQATASLQRDIVAGRPSEIDAPSGAVVRHAAPLGVPVPVHTTIHAALQPLERAARLARGVAAAALASMLILLDATPARAADVNGDPSNYAQLLATLKPGDTLHLAAGTYAPTGSTPLLLSNLNGTASQWITVTGPPGDPPTAVFQASPDGCCNVVEITNSSYLAVENLYLDGNHVSGAFGISASGGTSNLVHDIRIEGNTLMHMDNDGDPADLGQQDDGISTKTPTWGWIIRRNQILGAGTGMYLGNSDGSDPFVAGVIDDNLVDRPTGYCIEIKQQNAWPTVAGMPTGATATILSNNVFIKSDHAATTSGGRPQVLVDGFPTTGPGSQNHYEIFGNLFFHDADDFLLQATGRVHVHDNVFVDDSSYGAVDFVDHDGYSIIDAIAYNNTVYGVGTGIAFANAPSGTSFAVGNAIFAATAFSGSATTQVDNVTDTVANAGNYVVSPGSTLGTMDFYPKTGSALRGSTLDLSSVSSDIDYDLDFNGDKKDFTYRGAYSGQGTNPGWPLGDGIKDAGSSGEGGSSGGSGNSSSSSSSSGSGSGSSTGSSGGVNDGGGVGDTGSPGSSSSGCGCTASGAATAWPGPTLAMVLSAAIARRRRRVV